MGKMDALQQAIKPYQEALYAHPIYKELDILTHLKQFMGFHVYAVWDFMNLLTALQMRFTSTGVPWHPPEYPQLARFINDVKLEEESDVINGETTSHFSYYIKSMRALDVDTSGIDAFVAQLGVQSYSELIGLPSVPDVVRPFLNATYQCVQAGPVETAASFAFGRETLIPQMFVAILGASALDDAAVVTFKRYLERHIELDGDVHGNIALQLVSFICAEDGAAWERATQSAIAAIQARIIFYDGILAQLL
ncbi:MAG: DUF3050 domain-containing protein [bacterium]|nr:DUF3050 domain-containing protein [bacterium]